MLQEGEAGLNIIKFFSMIIMFLMIMVTGNLPLRWERFRKSSTLISLASAFSGGLFLGVGILHLLPEASESFEKESFEFPWANYICVFCFAFILFIEKILFASFVHHDEHGHGQEHEHHAHLPILPKSKHEDTTPINSDVDDVLQEKAQRRTSLVHQAAKEARRSSIMVEEPKLSKLTPYILQIAIGIHATFEGLAIGIADQYASCLGIALAVVCHKWAEGLTLGVAFFKADVELKMSTIMIAIQAVMNPIGIAIGWKLAGQSQTVRGVFQAISAGTFLYIATGEVISNEFNLKRHRYLKFLLFCLAIGFVTLLYFIEQWTEGDDDDDEHHHH